MPGLYSLAKPYQLIGTSIPKSVYHKIGNHKLSSLKALRFSLGIGVRTLVPTVVFQCLSYNRAISGFQKETLEIPMNYNRDKNIELSIEFKWQSMCSSADMGQIPSTTLPFCQLVPPNTNQNLLHITRPKPAEPAFQGMTRITQRAMIKKKI